MSEPDEQQNDEIDVGPLSEEQLRTLADDCILQLRRIASDLVSLGWAKPVDGTLDFLKRELVYKGANERTR